MTLWFRPRIRHPFFPGLSPVPAGKAKGRVLALCGAFAELEQAAAQGVSAGRAIFVLVEWDGPPFTLAQRDRLWSLFQAPVYAILMQLDGRVAGFECEAQNGFHVAGRVPSNAETVCECGRAGAMLGVNEGHPVRGKARLKTATEAV